MAVLTQPDDSPRQVHLGASDPSGAWRERLRERLDALDTFDPALRGGDSDAGLNPLEGPPPDLGGLHPAAVLIGLVEREAGLSVLLTRRSDGLRRHAGQIAFPGGRCDPGESPWEAALREAHEEIGLDPARVHVAGLSTPFSTWTGYHIIPVIGFVTPGFDLKLNAGEVAEAFEVPFDFLMDPANHERRQGQTPTGGARWYYAITYSRWTIWGATAAIIRALHDRLSPRDEP